MFQWIDEFLNKLKFISIKPNQITGEDFDVWAHQETKPLTNKEVIKYLRDSTMDKFRVSPGYNISTDDGWYFHAYDDCGEIDYIEYVIAPDGRRLDFENINEECQAVFSCMFENWY